jgi:hypothetical protein
MPVDPEDTALFTQLVDLDFRQGSCRAFYLRLKFFAL